MDVSNKVCLLKSLEVEDEDEILRIGSDVKDFIILKGRLSTYSYV